MNTKSPPVSPRGQNPIQRPAVTQKLPPSGKPDRHKSPLTSPVLSPRNRGPYPEEHDVDLKMVRKGTNQTITHDNPFPGSNFKGGSAEEPGTLDRAAAKVRDKGHKAKEKAKEKGNKLLEKTGSAVEMVWEAGKTVVDGAANIATQITKELMPDVFEDRSTAQAYSDIGTYEQSQPEFSYASKNQVKEAHQKITGTDEKQEAPVEWPLASGATLITPVLTNIGPKTPQYSSRFLGLIDGLIDVGNKIDNKFLGDKVPDTTVDRIKMGIRQFAGFFKKEEAPVEPVEEVDEETKLIEKLAKKAIHALTGLKPEKIANPDGSIGHQFAFDRQDLHTAFEHIAALNTLDPKLGSDLMRLAGDFVKGIFEDEKPKQEDKPARTLTDSAPQVIEDLRDSMFENRIRQFV